MAAHPRAARPTSAGVVGVTGIDDLPEGRPRIALADAREALGRGDFDTCLQACAVALGDDLLNADWVALREAALAEVRARAEGSRGSGAARWLGLLVRHDATAARSVHLGWQRSEVDGRSEALAPAAPEPSASRPRRVASSVHFEPCLSGASEGFTLTVDEAGEFQCVVADELTFGADPLGAHPPARLHAVSALRGGRTWRIVPGVVDVTVDGELVPEAGVTVRAGQRIAVVADDASGPTCFRLRTTDRSESLRLDFERGLERDRSVSVLLVADGRGGRLRIGGRRSYLIHTPSLAGNLELWVEERRLMLRGSEPLEVRASAASERASAIPPGRALRISLSLAERLDVQVRPEEPDRPPFWMRIAAREEGVARG